MFNRSLIVGVLASLMMVTYVPAQSAPQPLTNDDVVSLAKEGLPENTIVSAIQSQNNNFDLSATGLINLKKHDVTPAVIDAMLAASKAPAAAAAAPVQAAPAVAGQPFVTINDGCKKPLPLSKTQISQTKTKSSSLTGLAGDAALVSAFQGLALQAGTSALYRSGSVIGGGMLGSAGGMVSGFLSHRKPTVTEVWAVPGQKAETIAANNTPLFEVNFANIPGVNADEYEPVLIKLAPSPKNFRLVGATEAKQDVFESQSVDWQVYSSFVEERVASQAKKTATGVYDLAVSTPLGAGEYGVVLRPINKGKKFTASSVQQNSGDGMLFNSVWAFSIQ